MDFHGYQNLEAITVGDITKFEAFKSTGIGRALVDDLIDMIGLVWFSSIKVDGTVLEPDSFIRKISKYIIDLNIDTTRELEVDLNPKYFYNLRSLTIKNPMVITTNISPLTNLKSLSIEEQDPDLISDEVLTQLTNLTKLSLMVNESITDSGISLMTNLVSLSLDFIDGNAGVTNESITRLINLTSLTIIENYEAETITDVGISVLTNLTELELRSESEEYDDSITDESIRNLANLTHLDIDYNIRVTDAGISKLTNLVYLGSFNNERVTDDGISNLTNLEELWIYYLDDGATLSRMTNLTQLEPLNVDRNNTQKYEVLYKLPKLIELNLPI